MTGYRDDPEWQREVRTIAAAFRLQEIERRYAYGSSTTFIFQLHSEFTCR